MHPNPLALKFVIICVFIGCTLYVHFRGRVRHKLLRQITDHSTLFAPYNALMYLFSAVPNRPFVDVAAFPELVRLQQNWEGIRDEAAALFDEGHIRAASGYNDIGFNSFFRSGWKRFYVKWYNEPLGSAKALCPKTVALVESIPTINAAMFAMLEPGGRLVRHRDPFAGSLRYHLGLVTPNSEACRIFVDGNPYHWRDGEPMMFDETYIHHAENNSDVARLILFCDIERPLRSRVMTRVNRWFKRIVVRAGQTQNVDGEPVGALNKLFGYVYPVRLRLKRFKAWNRTAYYVAKFVVLGGLLAWILV